jgi:tRNA dimethylallyltransferase
MNRLIIISGPTASGKSYLADITSQKHDSVIINADSMQIYKELPILTAQPQKKTEKYTLYGILDYRTHCSAGKWVELATKKIDETIAADKRAIVVGGTGLYLKSLLYGIVNIPDIDPEIRQKVRNLLKEIGKEKFYKLLNDKDSQATKTIHANDSQRMMRAMEVLEQTGKSITSFKGSENAVRYKDYTHICLFPDREFLYQNCNSRFKSMLASGAIDEVKSLKRQINRDNKDYMLKKAIGFREISDYLDGNFSLEEATEKASQATRNYAKRQLTWFRNQMPDKRCIEYEAMAELKDELF